MIRDPQLDEYIESQVNGRVCRMGRWACLFLLIFVPVLSLAQNPAFTGLCTNPGLPVVLQGLSSTTLVPAIYPKCTVTVYNTGTLTLATIFSTPGGGALANPFQALTDGTVLFFAANGCYDVVLSASTSGGTPVMPGTYTYTDYCLNATGLGNLLQGGTVTGQVPVWNSIVSQYQPQIKYALDVRDFHGVTNDVALSAAIAALPFGGWVWNVPGGQTWAACPTWGGKSVQVVLAAGVTTIGVDCTIPSTVTLEFKQGAILKPAAGTTTTINGRVVASPVQQIFDVSNASAWIVPTTGVLEIPWYGVDCTQSTDASSVLNTITGVANRVSRRHVDLPAACNLLVTGNYWHIFGQHSVKLTGNRSWSDSSGPNILGSNAAGPTFVVYFSRTFSSVMDGFSIQIDNNVPGTFTRSLEIGNYEAGGDTSSQNIFSNLTITQGGTTVTGFQGIVIDNVPNQEMFYFDHVEINCGSTQNSYGFWSADNNADSTTLNHVIIGSCFRGIYMTGGRVRLYSSNITNNGRHAVFGDGGAAIYEAGGCVTDQVGNVAGDNSSQWLFNHTGACSHTLRGNQIGGSDYTSASHYLIDDSLGSYILLGNNFFSVQQAGGVAIGSSTGAAGCVTCFMGTVLALGEAFPSMDQIPQAISSPTNEQSSNTAFGFTGNGVRGFGPFVARSKYVGYGGFNVMTLSQLITPLAGINTADGNAIEFPGSANELMLADGVMGFPGLPSAWLANPSYTITGTAGTQSLSPVRIFPKDASGNRGTGTFFDFAISNAPNTMDGSNYVTVTISPLVAGAASYDVVVTCSGSGTKFAYTSVSLPYNIQVNPTCPGAYTLPTYNESASTIFRSTQGIKLYYGTPLICYSDGGSTNAACPISSSINLATGKQYQINGAQISSSNLSNDSSLVKLAGDIGNTAASPQVVSTHITGGTSTDLAVFSPTANLVNYAGTSCTNKAVTGLSAAGAATCTTLTSAYVDSSIAPTASPTFTGTVTLPLLATTTNCAVNSVSPAACGAASAGAFVIPNSQTSYTVNTTAVTAHSRIFLTPLTFAADLPSSPTCVVPTAGSAVPTISAISAGTSFSMTVVSQASTTCWYYWVVN